MARKLELPASPTASIEGEEHHPESEDAALPKRIFAVSTASLSLSHGELPQTSLEGSLSASASHSSTTAEHGYFRIRPYISKETRNDLQSAAIVAENSNQATTAKDQDQSPYKVFETTTTSLASLIWLALYLRI